MVHRLMRGRELILGSASERRYLLLKQIGLEPRIITVETGEQKSGASPRELAGKNAAAKNNKVREVYKGKGIIVTADTIVVAGKHILGKPADSDQAREFLRILSGKRHRVITGLTLFNGETGKTLTGEEETAVTFNKLSDEEINQYIATGEPFDKAGAYGIQGYAAQFVRKISGCYFNVVGFPIALFYGMLKEDVNV